MRFEFYSDLLNYSQKPILSRKANIQLNANSPRKRLL